MQPLPKENAQTSTHGFGISEAIAFAKNMGMLPGKLIVYAIAGDHFNISGALSPAVFRIYRQGS